MVGVGGGAERLRDPCAGPRTVGRQPRRAVPLKGFAVFEDGTTFSLSVLDIAYEGCRVETPVVLLPGLKLRISVLGLAGTVAAAVCWYKDGHAGLQFDPNEDPATSQRPRDYERVELEAEVAFRRSGQQNCHVRMFDLSPAGCKVEFVERPKADELLWIKFAGLEAIEAKLAWVDGFHGGLQFVRPIYPPVFEMLLAKLQG